MGALIDDAFRAGSTIHVGEESFRARVLTSGGGEHFWRSPVAVDPGEFGRRETGSWMDGLAEAEVMFASTQRATRFGCWQCIGHR